MEHASVSELKASFSQYLRRVKSGEEVVVTERGVPIARVVPLLPVSAAADDAAILALVRSGKARRGAGPAPAWLWEQPPKAKDPDAGVVAALLDERDAR